jgi:hypothetical protein
MGESTTAFSFAIPLRSRATARNWTKVCQLLNHTLASVLRQDDQDFSIVIACHDVPDIPLIHDPRIEVLVMDVPTPQSLKEQMRDKGRKKRACAAAFRKRGGGFLMFLDADDMVSRRLVSSVRGTPPRFGYLVDIGFQFSASTGSYHPLDRLYRRCGSCAIFRFSRDDLPEQGDSAIHSVSDEFKDHTRWSDIARDLGRPLEPLGWRAVVYVVETGESYVDQALIELGPLSAGRPVDETFCDQFGVPWRDGCRRR